MGSQRCLGKAQTFQCSKGIRLAGEERACSAQSAFFQFWPSTSSPTCIRDSIFSSASAQAGYVLQQWAQSVRNTTEQFARTEELHRFYRAISPHFTSIQRSCSNQLIRVSIEILLDFSESTDQLLFFSRIERKLSRNQYRNYTEFAGDMRQMIIDTYKYNHVDSPIVTAAGKLHKEFELRFSKINFDDDSPTCPPINSDGKQIWSDSPNGGDALWQFLLDT